MSQLPYETPRPPSPNRWLWWAAAGVLVVAILGAAFTVSRDQQPDVAPSPTSSEPAIATQPSPVLPSPQAAPAPTTQPAVPIPTGILPTEVLVDFVMPDLVGLDLQTAQDTIQANGVFLSRSHDLLGDRRQVVDANWVVCDQNIAAGEQVTGVAEGRIDLGVVQTDEQCP